MGGKGGKAPNTVPLMNAANYASSVGAQLGNRQMALAEQQYYENRDLFKYQILPAQLAAQNEQLRQARDYYDYSKETFRPLEKSLVEDAMNFDTKGMRDRLAREAGVEYGKAASIEDQILARQQAARGVNPNSGAARALNKSASIQRAAGRADAMTRAGQQAQDMAIARKYAAAGLGRGLPGYSTAAYAGSVGAGNSAMKNQLAPGALLQSGLSAGAGTVMQGAGYGIQGLSSVLNSDTSIYKANLDYAGSLWQGLGSMAGGALGSQFWK